MNELTSEEREVLARLELLAHGSTQRFDSSGGRNADHAPQAPGPLSDYPHLYWKHRLETARNDYTRSKALESAQDELDSWRRRAVWTSATIETWAELVDRVISEGSGWSVREVANHCRCSERQVVKARTQAGVSVDDGKPSAGHRGSVYSYKQGCRCGNCRAAWAQKAWDRRHAA